MRIILASQSPRRLELLRQIGIEPEVVVSGIPERTEETVPERVVMDLSRQKAEHVVEEIRDGSVTLSPETAAAVTAGIKKGLTPMEKGLTPMEKGLTPGGEKCLVIGADTVVCIDGKILGKPHSHEEAEEMIRELQGRTHQVVSGVSIIDLEDGRSVSFAEKTDVCVYAMTEQEIHDYAWSEEPMDKAGAYGIQGNFGKFIRRIDGDYTNVVGLPVAAVYHHLGDF